MILLVHFDRVTKNFGICSNPLSRVQAFNASKKPVGRLDEIGIKNIFDNFFPHFLSLSCRISQKVFNSHWRDTVRLISTDL